MLYTNRECLDGNSTKIWCHIRSAKLTSGFDWREMQSGDLRNFSSFNHPCCTVVSYSHHIKIQLSYTIIPRLYRCSDHITMVDRVDRQGDEWPDQKSFQWTPAHP